MIRTIMNVTVFHDKRSNMSQFISKLDNGVTAWKRKIVDVGNEMLYTCYFSTVINAKRIKSK